MSDIAPFVAAVIRDKTVMDLLGENRKLQTAIYNTKIVQIRTSGGKVCNQRLFTEGCYGNANTQWCLPFVKNTASALPIHALPNLELCIGGNVFATAGDYARSGRLCSDPLDGDDQKVASFFSGKDWLRVLIVGWPRESWETFPVAFPGLYDFMYQRLIQTVSEEYPEATVLIQDVSFLCESVSGIMVDMPPPLELEDDDDDDSMLQLENVG
jgi:hypothetical protein